MISLTEAILSLGTNLGDRMQNLKNALAAISNITETETIKISNFYETEPFGVPIKQDDYINCCVRIATGLESPVLMGACLGIEAALGRTRQYRFAPRVIDIDLLIYGHEYRNDKNLILPHPRIKERAFVLIPMSELCESMTFGNVDFKESFKQCDSFSVKLLK